MKSLHTQLFTAIGAITLGTAVALAPVSSHAIDYAGKKIQIVVASKEGGSTDRYSRIFQPFLEKYLPGKPTVLVVMKPGGSGVKASNWFEKKANRDGTTLLTTGSSVYTSFMFGGKKVKFDLLKWNPVVMSPFGTCFYAHKKSGVKGKDPVADIKKLRAGGNLMMGMKNPTSSELRAFLSYDILGIHNVKPIFGIRTGERRKAVLRGELQLSIDSALKCQKVKKKYVTKGTVAIYMSLGFLKADGSVVRDPSFPNKPHVLEIYKMIHGKALTGVKLKTFKHFVNMAVMSNKTMWLPKGASKKVYKLYVSTIKRIYKDKKFKKMTKKTFGKYPQAFGDRARQVLKGSVDFSPETKKWMLKWIDKKIRPGT